MNITLNKYLTKDSIFIKYKVQIFFLLKLLIAAGLIVYIVSVVNPSEIINAFNQANIVFLIAASVLTFVNIYLQYYKWKLTCSFLLNENSGSKIFTSLMHGIAAGVFTPARIGEYFGRALVFRNKPVYKVALATALDKFFPLLMVAFFGSISSIIFLHIEYEITTYITLSLFIVLFSLFYLFFYLLMNENFWDSMIFTKLKQSSMLNYLFEKLKEVKNLNRSYTTKMIFISFLFYSCFLLQYAMLVSAFSNHLNIIDYLWAGNLLMFAKTIIPPVSLGELGIREGASVYFITKLGESSSTGFNAAIFLFLINVLIPAIAGLILLLKKSND